MTLWCWLGCLLIVAMVAGLLLHLTSQSSVERCWLCFAPVEDGAGKIVHGEILCESCAGHGGREWVWFLKRNERPR